MAPKKQKFRYNQDVQALIDNHKRRTENLVKLDFLRKVQCFDDLLRTDQFSVETLESLMTDSRAVRHC